MPTPQFSKPWHGVPREQIYWNPTINEDTCIGCGTCVTGCSRMVYRFDFDRKKPIVVDPLNCMVGCTTCANTCPANAINFPPIESVLAMEGLNVVRHAIEDDLLNRHDLLKSPLLIPHPDRIINLLVTEKNQVSSDVLRVQLQPVVAGECFCEFVPGQYLELWQPDSPFMSRGYSIANTPQGDGSVELHIRRVEGGRLTTWLFNDMQVGDRLKARGPLGRFTMRSEPEVPLLFIAGGTGFAPILALLRQQARSQPQRDMLLIWGGQQAQDFYALDELLALLEQLPNFKIVLATNDGVSVLPTHSRLTIREGNTIEVLDGDESLLVDRDLYAAGPPGMLRALSQQLDRRNIARDRIHMDSLGV